MTDKKYDDDHVGEKPTGWPRARITELGGTWGADEIVEDIEQCRGCSHEYGLCDRHRGVIKGYDEGVRDMTRVANLAKEDLLDD